MSNSTSPQGTVQYYDHAWGGWRNLTAFGDRPRDTWAVSTAKTKAKELSGGTVREIRVLVEGQSVARYRGGQRVQ